jgi:hypothetical protein
MLSQILKEFRESGGAIISLNGLSRRLGVERSALDGMLETLVRQGKLREVCASGSSGGCHCGGGCRGCKFCHPDGAMGKSYALVLPEPLDKGV